MAVSNNWTGILSRASFKGGAKGALAPP